MQPISPLTQTDLLAKVKQIRYKFELYVDGAWVDVNEIVETGPFYGDPYYGEAFYGGTISLLKSVSVKLGGAGASPDPVAGSWSAEVQNPGGIFHPFHPTSAYKTYFRVGRKVRISVGGVFGGAVHYWQRLIGYMGAPTFNHAAKTVTLKGLDFMKPLADTALRSPANYWGASATFSSVETAKTFGAEKYVENDALLCQPPGNDLDVDPVGWETLHGVFISEEETGGGSDFVGHLETSGDYGWTSSEKVVGSIVNGKVYEISFKYQRRVFAPYDSGASLTLSLHEIGTNKVVAQAEGLASAAWTTVKIHFTAPCSCNTYMKLLISPTIIDTPPYITVYYIDQLTFREVTARVNTRYVMPAACNGVYYVTLDGVPLWYGDNNAGWLYDEANKTFYFNDNVWVETGTNNLIVYYFTTQDIMDVLGDLLVTAGLYASRAAALAALEYTDPNIGIPKVWFEAGTPTLDAVRRICERCNYRFWFAYDGTPTFKPAPTATSPVFTFSLPGQVRDPGVRQDLAEIRNRIVIEGMERGAFSTAKDKKTSRLVCAATYDQPSIDAYLERAFPITNDLFQDQASLDAMAAALLAAFKDPKWYTEIKTPFNPVPLELGDTIAWPVELAVAPVPGEEPVIVDLAGIIRDIDISGGEIIYACQIITA